MTRMLSIYFLNCYNAIIVLPLIFSTFLATDKCFIFCW